MTDQIKQGLTIDDAIRMRGMAEYLESLGDPDLLDSAVLRVMANRIDPKPEFTHDDVEFMRRLATGLSAQRPADAVHLRDMAERCISRPLEDWEKCRLAFQSHPRGGSEAWIAAAKAIRGTQ